MNVFVIALRSMQQRALASSLTMLSMGLGVLLVVIVLSLHGVVTTSFRNNSSLGFNLIVGAKGGKEQLVLNTVYYLSQPVENVPASYYMEFLKREQRDELLETSLALHAQRLREETLALATATGGLPGGFLPASLAVEEATNRVALARTVELGRNGKYGSICAFAIPLCLGDYLDRFRVVGTTPEFFDKLQFGAEQDRKYEFAQGRNFVHKSEEHGYFEAVLGANVARELNLTVGSKISPNHGAPDGHKHERKFTVVGVLKPTGTPNDRAVFVNMEGFYLMEDHAKPLEEEAIAGTNSPVVVTEQDKANEKPIEATAIDDPQPLPLEQREITSLLIRTTSPILANGLSNAVNEGQFAQAVFPVQVIYTLLDFIVKPIQQMLLLLTVMVCVVSGISILVSMYNSMSERRHEIAVMRSLGASRGTIFGIILLEAIFISLAGGAIGWLVGHSTLVALSPMIDAKVGVRMSFFHAEPRIMDLLQLFFFELDSNNASRWMMLPAELVLLPFLIIVAVLVGLVPAWSAYRTDVAKSLGK